VHVGSLCACYDLYGWNFVTNRHSEKAVKMLNSSNGIQKASYDRLTAILCLAVHYHEGAVYFLS
jgi:hypothetical protein